MKNRSLFIMALMFNIGVLSAQMVEIISKQDLPQPINETSGLAEVGGLFLTHNDSGGKPNLYSFTSQGQLQDTIAIVDQKNTDWEDLAQDDQFIYIANTGNNFGKRKKLRILKLPKALEAPVKAEVIRVNYAQQQDFTPRKKHPYDSEGLTAMGDHLLMFSKDRLHLQTHLYKVPKQAGKHTIDSSIGFDVQSLVTGADYDEKSHTLALTAYSFEGIQYLYVANDVNPNQLEKIELKEFMIPQEPAQIEAIRVIDAQSFWVTSEAESKGLPYLLKISIAEKQPIRTLSAN